MLILRSRAQACPQGGPGEGWDDSHLALMLPVLLGHSRPMPHLPPRGHSDWMLAEPGGRTEPLKVGGEEREYSGRQERGTRDHGGGGAASSGQEKDRGNFWQPNFPNPSRRGQPTLPPTPLLLLLLALLMMVGCLLPPPPPPPRGHQRHLWETLACQAG